MAAKNYSELIKNKHDRTLTAKGNRFVWKCVEIIAKHKNTHRYSKEFTPVRSQFIGVLKDLIIEKEMSIKQITDLIKSRSWVKELDN